jgi:hypothetical protein
MCWMPVYKTVWHIPLLSVQWINSWWWTEELSETCRVSCQNKFVNLVHLVDFIIMKFGTMHGHMNVKLDINFTRIFLFRSTWENCGGNTFYFRLINVHTELNVLVCSLISLIIKNRTQKIYFWISGFFLNFWT